MAVKNSLLDDQLVEKSNGVYKFDPAAIRVGLIAGIGGMLLFGTLGILAGKDENFSSRSWILYLLPSLGFIFVLSHIAKLSGRTLHISTDRISVQDKRGNEIGSLPWVEFANLTERRKMAQLALWDKSGTRRLLIDLQFENFNLIRSRILGEYAKVFTLKPLPIVFQSANSFLFESFVLAVGAAFFVWGSWRTLQQGQTGASIVFFCFVILALLSFLKLYPQLGGPSGLFEDRIVLRSLFKTQELYRKNITGVEIGDMANPRSGTKFSMVILKAIGGKQLKVTAQYGNIPEIYVTLRAWLAQQS